MAVKVERRDDAVILTPEGILWGGETSELRKQLEASLKEKGVKKIIVDLAFVNNLNSTALHLLESTDQATKKRSISFLLCNLEKRINNILVIKRLNRKLVVVNDVPAALTYGGD